MKKILYINPTGSERLQSVVKVIPFLILLINIKTSDLSGQEYIIGADLSDLKKAEDSGFSFKENNIAKPGLLIFKDHGYNWIRLRLFHTPSRMHNNLEYTIALAKKAKENGFKFLLDFHYADSWADPGNQTIPKAWTGMSHNQLERAVFEYTRVTIKAFKEAGVLPEMVQIGNEVGNGILWPDGKLPANWDNFAKLLKAGINGVNAGCDSMDRPKFMIHLNEGGNKNLTKNFFDMVLFYGIDFDYIGQSYYPWWHGSLLDLRNNMIFMAETYKKPIILVEVAYNYTPAEYKSKRAPFAETPEGQKEFLDEVNRIVLNTPDNLGVGIFWWEPATMASYKTRSFFDEKGNVLPVITVFDKYTRH